MTYSMSDQCAKNIMIRTVLIRGIVEDAFFLRHTCDVKNLKLTFHKVA